MAVDFVETYAAAIAAVFGGVGVKLLEKMLSKRSEAFEESSKLREELRAEIALARTERDAAKRDAEEAQNQADQWREKYWEMVEENSQLNTQFETLRLSIETRFTTSGSL